MNNFQSGSKCVSLILPHSQLSNLPSDYALALFTLAFGPIPLRTERRPPLSHPPLFAP